MYEIKTCYTCSGSGVVGDWPKVKVCPTCKGQGVVVVRASQKVNFLDVFFGNKRK